MIESPITIKVEWVKKLYEIYWDEDWDNIYTFNDFIDYALKTKMFDLQIGTPYKQELPC